MPSIEAKHASKTHAHTDMHVHIARQLPTKRSSASNTKTAQKLPQIQTNLLRPPNHRLPTPVLVHHLESQLQGYDQTRKLYLVEGFSNGFRLGCMDPPQARSSQNHSSVISQPDIVSEKMQQEMQLGRIAGPFDVPPFENLICSPLALIPKSAPGKFRLIHNLSYPRSNSVNLGIPREFSAVQYDTVDSVVSLVKTFGFGCLMAKTDIEDAFRIIPIHPEDYFLLGFIWKGQYYYEKVLPMGASSSCQIFDAFSTALQWIMMNHYGSGGMSHILDDFFFIGSRNSESCLHDLQTFMKLCSYIGVPIKYEKTTLPATEIIILL